MSTYDIGPYNAGAWLIDRNIAGGRSERIAIRSNGKSYSYGDVMRSTWRAQQTLAHLDIQAGERVVLLTNDGPDMVAWLLGCLRPRDRLWLQHRDAQRHADAMARHRAELMGSIEKLETTQDELLDRLIAETR